jgi:hypothetical protein
MSEINTIDNPVQQRIITIEPNLEHLRYLGLKPGNCADAWKSHFKCAPWGKCLACGFKIRINRVIAKIIGNKFHGAKDWPPAFFIFGPSEYALRVHFMSAEAQGYYSSGSNKAKTSMLVPACFRCWTMSLENNYQADGLPVDPYVYALLTIKQCDLTPDQALLKVQYETEYVTEYKKIIKPELTSPCESVFISPETLVPT